jgi:hypothetical protein
MRKGRRGISAESDGRGCICGGVGRVGRSVGGGWDVVGERRRRRMLAEGLLLLQQCWEGRQVMEVRCCAARSRYWTLRWTVAALPTRGLGSWE